MHRSTRLVCLSLLCAAGFTCTDAWVVGGLTTMSTPALCKSVEEGKERRILIMQSKNKVLEQWQLATVDAVTGKELFVATELDFTREQIQTRLKDMAVLADPLAPADSQALLFTTTPKQSLRLYNVTTKALEPLWTYAVANILQMSAPAVNVDLDPHNVYITHSTTHGQSAKYPQSVSCIPVTQATPSLPVVKWSKYLAEAQAASTPLVYKSVATHEDLLAVVTSNKLFCFTLGGIQRWVTPSLGVTTLLTTDPPAYGNVTYRSADGSTNTSRGLMFFALSMGEMEPCKHKIVAVNDHGKVAWEYKDIRQGYVSQVSYSALNAIVVFTFFSVDQGTAFITAIDANHGVLVWEMSDPHNSAHLSRPVLSEEEGLIYMSATTSISLDLWAFTMPEAGFYWSSSVVLPSNCTSTPPGLASGLLQSAEGGFGRKVYGTTCDTTIPPYALLIDGLTGYVPGIDGALYNLALPSTRPLPSPSPHSGSGGSIPSYVFYIAACCGAIVVLLIACLPRFFCKNKKGYKSLSLTQQYDDAIRDIQRRKRESESRYTAIRKLGHGAFGEVYEVRCKKDGKHYALKRIPCDSEPERNEAIREWRMLCEIEHPNKILAYETFVNWATQPKQTAEQVSDVEVRRYVCIIMDYCPGGDLRRFVCGYKHAQQRIPEETILSYSAQICSLLVVLHAQSPPLVHRDLKPENVLLKEDNTRVVVTDFGLARLVSAGSYLSSHAGTVAYIAPETWDRHYSTGADVWALGCMIYAMCSRRVSKSDVRVLWRESAAPDFQAKLQEEIRTELGYSPELAEFTVQLLTPDRKLRPSAERAYQWLQNYYPDTLAPLLSHSGPITTSATPSPVQAARQAPGGGSPAPRCATPNRGVPPPAQAEGGRRTPGSPARGINGGEETLTTSDTIEVRVGDAAASTGGSPQYPAADVVPASSKQSRVDEII